MTTSENGIETAHGIFNKNTYDGKLNIKDGEIQTSKKYEMDEHGVGIKNIIEVITKYQGSYAIRNDNNEFYFSVILPN